MQKLNPTLWRTCKMLAGRTRIKLLRELYAHTGEDVSTLGKRVQIGHAAASQELRRIQSRGFLQARRLRNHVIYQMAADPQVSSAQPLLKAIQTALDHFPPERDEEMCKIAAGLSHERRIQIARYLLKTPQPMSELPYALHIPMHPFQKHWETLRASGFVVRSGDQAHFDVPAHPLAKALAQLLLHGVTR